jgi:hypothetical protein
LEVWIKKGYEGVFFLNSSFNPYKVSHEKEAGSNSGSGGGDVIFIEEFQLLTLER